MTSKGTGGLFLALAALLLVAPAATLATPATPAAPDPGMPQLDIDPLVLTTEAFLSAHPDIRWQREGMHSYERGEYAIALEQFQRAARHGDKLSQAMVASMYWDGVGVPRDREIGYAWMDVAAERMYPALLAMRENYWAELDVPDRRRALRRGQAVLAEYGDAAAKPRLEKAMKRGRRIATGTRLGADSSFTRIIPLTGAAAQSHPFGINLMMTAGHVLTGDQYYADQYWSPAEYWKLHDRAWSAPDPEGRVKVGVPRSAR